MALLPPSPLGQPPGNSFWNDWYEKLRTIINTGAVSVGWANVTGTPTTLAGYGIVDAQPLSPDLSAYAALASNGIVVRTGAGTSTTRSVTVSGLLSVTNGDGVGGNPSIGLAATISPTWTGNHTFSPSAGDTIFLTGNVGVGVAAPAAFAGFRTVEIRGTTATTGGVVQLSNSTNTLSGQLYIDTAGTKLNALTGALNLQVNNVTHASIASTGQLRLGTVGAGYSIAEGANAKQGAATLVAGTVVVSTTAVTANSRIHLTGQNSSGTPGHIYVSARVAGTSFTITSTSAADTRLVAWTIFEPS